MNKKLLDYTASELLEKFGAGSHKPGSGSAAALSGMMSCQLLRTVIDLTNDPKRRLKYARHLPQLLEIKGKIEQTIFPGLAELFQKDSDHFGVVITLRKQRDHEKNYIKERELALKAQQELKVATTMPLEIAEYCLKLVDLCDQVFDHGFRSARGDSGVALNYAMAGVGGCLSIVELNLSSLQPDEWMDKALVWRTNIKGRFEEIRNRVNEKLTILEKETEEVLLFRRSIAEFQEGNLAESNRSTASIEKLARKLQNTLWTHRNLIWKKETPTDYLEILSPEIVLKKIMDYAYFEQDGLGTHEVGGEQFEIAGLIDKSKKLVVVSKNFPNESQRFTAAHELGHAILHPQTLLHRDKSIDGSGAGSRALEEMQADKFATYFLMPGKMVADYFETLFQMPTFVINENTVHYLGLRSVHELRRQCGNLRGLSRLLASTEYFAGKPFKSLSKIFGVSNTTMAIRLEELGLVEF